MRRFILAAALSCSVTIASAASENQGGFVFKITSSEAGTAFSAVCTLVRNGVEIVEDHSGVAPVTLHLEADRVRCELSSKGQLNVSAEGPGGNRSLTSTSGGGIIVISL